MAHTIKVIGGGFALLFVCLVVSHWTGHTGSSSIARGALVFIPLWLIGAGINMWIGVTKAGYSVKEETPFFFIVFLIPATVALFVWWTYSKQA